MSAVAPAMQTLLARALDAAQARQALTRTDELAFFLDATDVPGGLPTHAREAYYKAATEVPARQVPIYVGKYHSGIIYSIAHLGDEVPLEVTAGREFELVRNPNDFFVVVGIFTSPGDHRDGLLKVIGKGYFHVQVLDRSWKELQELDLTFSLDTDGLVLINRK